MGPPGTCPDPLTLNVGLNVWGYTNLGNSCGDQLTVNALADFLCDVDIGSANFTVLAATGNTAIQGTLTVVGQITGTGGLDLEGFDVIDTSGNTTITGTLNVTGSVIQLGDACGDQLNVLADADFFCDVEVYDDWATPALTFDIDAPTGNTTIAGTLDVAGDFDVNTGEFYVTAADGSLNIGPGNFTVAGATGNTYIMGTLEVDGATIDLGDGCTDQLTVNALADFLCDVDVGTGNFTIAAASGNTYIAGTLDVDGDFDVNSGEFYVTAADGSLNIGPNNFTVNGTNGTLAINTNQFVVTGADGSLNIGPGLFTVDGADGDTYIDKDLDVDNNVILGSACTDTLQVNSAATFDCAVTLNVSQGNTTVIGNLDPQGDINKTTGILDIEASSDITFRPDNSASSQLTIDSVSPQVEVTNDFRVGGTSNMVGQLTINTGGITILAGGASITGTIGITGAVSITAGLNLLGSNLTNVATGFFTDVGSGGTPVTNGYFTNLNVTNLNVTAMGGDLDMATFNINIDSGTATAVAGAATLNAQAGIVTTAALATAAGGTYTLTLTNSDIAAASNVMVTVGYGTCTTGDAIVQSVTPAAGSCVIVIKNVSAVAAFNGTLLIQFLVVDA